MDITNSTAVTTAVAGLLSPIIIQVGKRWVPDQWRPSFTILVSILIGCLAIAATGGSTPRAWGVYLTAVVGISQTVYALIIKTLSVEKDK